MRPIDADELKTAFPCGESVRTECVHATIDHMPTIEPQQVTGKLDVIDELPSVQPTLYGYKIEHLAYIVRVIEKAGITAEDAARTFGDLEGQSPGPSTRKMKSMTEVLRGLRACVVSPESCGAAGCPYEGEADCVGHLMRHALVLLEDSMIEEDEEDAD